MPKYIIEIWETRSYHLVVEANDKDEAKEIASDDYAELSTRDEFVSVEVREIELEEASA